MQDNGKTRRSQWHWYILSYVAVFALVSLCTSVFYTHSECSKDSPLAKLGPAALHSTLEPSGLDVAGGQGAALYPPVYNRQAAPASYDATRDVGYHNRTAHPICKFLASSQDGTRDELHWGKYDLCLKKHITPPIAWMRQVGTNCYRCSDSANICQNPPTIIYHQYLDRLHPTAWHRNLLSLQAYLLTQDLEYTEMWLWADDISQVYNNKTKPFFDTFKAKIKLKTFDHDQIVKGTVWEGDPFFSNGNLVRRYMKAAETYSDVARLPILWHYGGFWMDNDVILLRDLYPLLSVSYQFIMRWTHGNSMLMFKGSRLMHTLMTHAKAMPLTHRFFKQVIINRMCKPLGYYQVSPEDYGYTDVYNGCLFRLVRIYHNKGPRADRMYELPLGWFDQELPGCQAWHSNVTDAHWQWLARSHLALHTRYLKRVTQLPAKGTYLRAKRLIDEFYRFCNKAECVPSPGADLVEYEGIREAAVARSGLHEAVER